MHIAKTGSRGLDYLRLHLDDVLANLALTSLVDLEEVVPLLQGLPMECSGQRTQD